MQTIESRLILVEYRPSGFDYLRLFLSISVVCFHSVITSYGKLEDVEMWNSWLGVPVRFILPMFFALSGFLVAGSLARNKTISGFLWLRVVRIYPALVVEVLLSALVLGPLLTSKSASDYFTDAQFLLYFWNMVGHIHYLLPGLFETNPFPLIVNAQLWTVPYELYCYISLAALSAFGLKKSFYIAAITPVGLVVVYFLARFIANNGTFPAIGGGVTGVLLVDAFLFGVALYFLRSWLPWNALTFSFALIGAICAAKWFHYGILLLPAFTAYLVVYLGLMNPRRIKIIAGADYSYGIFLYGFVIQQALVSYFPIARIWWANIIIALPITTIFAALSWHFIEKPALRLKYLPSYLAQLKLDFRS
ncbi:acyltransferase family protein [Variovorax sp. RHLX14]|uniref:acyltransferase family protein n=1 Tax=Variovorax sp. RHLX14 TaxID=1259731 RepID=UPI003F46003F